MLELLSSQIYISQAPEHIVSLPKELLKYITFTTDLLIKIKRA